MRTSYAVFCLNEPAPTEIYTYLHTLSLHDALPISVTRFLNGREIVTRRTIGDHPDYLAVGYLLNQNMLQQADEIVAIEHDADLGVVVVRTPAETDFEDKLARRR